MLLMFHDDNCGEFLDKDGQCPKCRYHPDMQSTAFRELSNDEVTRRLLTGETFFGEHRKPVVGEQG